MNKRILLISFLIATTMAVYGQAAKSYSAESERRIVVILDTLKSDYYWQQIPAGRMGYVPPNFNYEIEKKKYPFRVERDNYLDELDSLMNEKVYENLIIDLLNRSYKEWQYDFFDKVCKKIVDFKTDRIYDAMFHFVMANPQHYKLASALVQDNKYKQEIKNRILIASKEEGFIEYGDKYLHLFDKETDKKLLDAIAEKVEENLVDNPFSACLQAGCIAAYYKLDRDKLDEYQPTKKYLNEIQKLGNGEKLETARNNYWRSWAESVLKYHREQN